MVDLWTVKPSSGIATSVFQTSDFTFESSRRRKGIKRVEQVIRVLPLPQLIPHAVDIDGMKGDLVALVERLNAIASHESAKRMLQTQSSNVCLARRAMQRTL